MAGAGNIVPLIDPRDLHRGLGYDVCINSRIANNVILKLRSKPGGESGHSASLHFPAELD